MSETATETLAPPALDRPAPDAVAPSAALPPDAPGRGGAETALDTDHTRFVCHLHFEHLRNLTTLSVSATGGGLIALQAGLLDIDGLADEPALRAVLTALPLLCFAFAAVVSLVTQRVLIRDLGTAGAPSTAFAWMSEIASGLFGAGVGSAAAILIGFRLL